MKKTMVRFSPSPTSLPDETGRYNGLHLGGARTALFSYLWGKSLDKDAVFAIRSEDSDNLRSSKGSEEAILESLAWLGLISDIPIVRQSERAEIYQKYLDKMLEDGTAYRCYCTPERLDKVRQEQIEDGQKPMYDRTCLGLPDDPSKPHVVRLKVPSHGRVKINDRVLGRIQLNNLELSDPILRRTDGSFCFLFVNILDDILQGVTHVLRASEGIGHCHSQCLICEALGFEPPEYAHVGYVLNEDKKKLSKRDGAFSVLDLRDEGYLSEAVLNTIAKIGASYKGKEIISREEMENLFNIRNVSKSAGIFDKQKLDDLNRHYIKSSNPEKIASLLQPFLLKEGLNSSQLTKVDPIKVVQSLNTRATTLVEMAKKAKFYYDSSFTPERKLRVEEKNYLNVLKENLKAIDFSFMTLEKAIEKTGAHLGVTLKEIGPALRMALVGTSSSPSCVEVMDVLGKEEVILRIDRALS